MAKISEALHYAADVLLCDGAGDVWRPRFSCIAAEFACTEMGIKWRPVCQGLRNMGVEPDGFGQFEDVKDPQGARYMWLKFAALMAEEQGL